MPKTDSFVSISQSLESTPLTIICPLYKLGNGSNTIVRYVSMIRHSVQSRARSSKIIGAWRHESVGSLVWNILLRSIEARRDWCSSASNLSICFDRSCDVGDISLFFLVHGQVEHVRRKRNNLGWKEGKCHEMKEVLHDGQILIWEFWKVVEVKLEAEILGAGEAKPAIWMQNLLFLVTLKPTHEH